jgi:phosphoserine phosphatase RsbU/P
MLSNMEEKNIDRYTLKYLERQVYNLGKLIDINGIINSTLDIGQLLNLIMAIIKDIMETDASTLLLYEEASKELVFKVALGEAGKELEERYRVKIGQGIAGWVAENRKAAYINDVYNDRRFDPNFDRMTGFTTKSVLCAPLLFKGKLLGVIQAINPLNKDGFDDEDVVLFNAFSTQAVLAVQNAIFFQNAIEEERIKNELTSANSIQKSLMPPINLSRSNVEISARSIPAREIGGEFYDIFYYEDGSTGIALGDLHMKGIPGGLHASIISGAVKATSMIRGRNPYQLSKILNDVIRSNLKTGNRVSLFYGVLSPDGKSIQLVNSGISYPILIRNGIARYIKFSGSPLGDGELDSKLVKVNLQPGDSFLIITDGIVKLKNRSAHQLGLKKIMDFLGGRFSSADNIVNSMISFADDFTEGLEKIEDISIIAIRIG